MTKQYYPKTTLMDYYAECQKMFTTGQITRADAALLTPARQSLYQYDNLVATGVLSPASTNACVIRMFINKEHTKFSNMKLCKMN
jgi:hypothetical protein